MQKDFMNSKVSISIVSALLFTLFIWQHDALALATRGKVLRNVTLREADGSVAVSIGFNFPIRYLRHFPPGNGRELRIQLEPIVASREDRVALQQSESIFPPKGNPASVSRLEYEGRNLLEPTITVFFSQSVEYTVEQGSDFRSIVVRVSAPQETGAPSPSDKAAQPPEQGKQASDVPSPHPLTAETEQRLIKEGAAVMAAKNYPRAIQVYTKLLDASSPAILEEAQFQLALAREYNGHLAHAKAEYQNYLSQFPDGIHQEEANRRLQALLSTSGLARASDSQGQGPLQSTFYGSISQVVNHERIFADDDVADDFEYSSMATEFDATWQATTENYQMEGVIIGSQIFDLNGNRDDETRISSLYLDLADSADTFGGRFGRQSGNSGGVLGRFDGGEVSYQVHDKARLHLVAGFPVDRSQDDLQTDKYFYGVNVDVGRLADHWDFNFYFINQIADEVDDRRALGAEVRYLGDRSSIFSLVDYDILFNELNIALLAGSYMLEDNKTQFNFSADYRKNPALTTSNGGIGQMTDSISDLVDQFTEEGLRDLARDRTLDSWYVSLGATHQLTENLQLAGDVAWLKLDGSPASGGIEAVEGTGNEYFYTVQLISSNLFKPGSLSSIGLRYADTSLRDIYTLDFNTSLPVNDRWKVNPRLQIDYRVNTEQDGEQWRLRPSLGVDYHLSDTIRLEAEGGIAYADQELPGVADGTFGYYLTLGVRWDF